MVTTPTRPEPAVGRRYSIDEPVAHTPVNASINSPSVLLFIVLALLGALAYSIFLLNPENRGDLLPFVLVIIAEVVLISHALVSLWTILSGGQDPRGFAFHRTQREIVQSVNSLGERPHVVPQSEPLRIDEAPVTIDVFITVYGEPLEVIERTATAALAMHGQHETWILDDGRSDDVRELAARLGARYIRRLSSNGAKAGNVNHALSVTSGEYFAIFDADFVPAHDFLIETVPFFVEEKVAFVQTPQTYGNHTTLIARGAAFMQSLFYRFVQPGRNRFNAAFCVGTNVVFRRTAIDNVGGIYTDSLSEDVWTSLMLHERGWTSVYIPITLAVGDAPETIEDYTKQQMRWATGGFEILLTHNPLSRRRRLTPDQRIQYLVTATHYLIGIVPLMLLMVPPLEIFFDLRPVNLGVTPFEWFAFYFGFYGLQILLAFATMGSFRWETLMLAAVSFPIYLRALINVITGRRKSWHVTGGARKRQSPFNYMVPQTLFFVFLALTSVVAIYKDLGNGALTLATAWNVTNTLIICAFIITAVIEARRIRLADRAARRRSVRMAATARSTKEVTS
ncbi:glycosyltransferase family 2 protein [Microcella sp.]|uniref:glycosyltransferase family 2 protein n=1 Tax=Microcella sp. TaxID=1913979 RepID=UPI002564B1B4|nr:glycosyltransferase family 2 protein [Microcella sp.]MBX9471092.1 glycosyltransferase [Microcella sp.]